MRKSLTGGAAKCLFTIEHKAVEPLESACVYTADLID